MKKIIPVFLLLFQFCFINRILAQDWPGLSVYHDDNELLKAGGEDGKRVVFMGNSITDAWIKSSPEFFSANHFIDRGISGQTTPQMLVRFRADVINLKPQVVVILAGTNDIAGNTGPATLEMIEDNLSSMADLARANNIKVILCSVLPVYQYPWKPEVKPVEKISALNDWIKAYADRSHFVYLDYYHSLVDDRKGMKAEYSEDGVHPNKLGYAVMEKLSLPLIQITLQ